MTLIAWIVSFLRPYRARVVTIAILSVVEIGLAALGPWPLKVVVDNVLGGQPLPASLEALIPAAVGANAILLLVLIVVAGLVLQIVNEVVRMIHTQMQVDMGQRIVYDLRGRLLAHLQALPLGRHVLTRTADSVYRLDADAYCVNDLVTGGVFPLAVAVLNLGVMFAILVQLDLTLALLSLAVVPFLYVCLRHYSRRMTDRAERVKILESTLIERAFEILSSIAAIKSFARERHELARFARSGEDTMRARLRLTWQESLFSVAVSAITLAGTALVLTVGGMHVLDGTLTVGLLVIGLPGRSPTARCLRSPTPRGAAAGDRRAPGGSARSSRSRESRRPWGHRRVRHRRARALRRRQLSYDPAGGAGRGELRGATGRDGGTRPAHRRWKDDDCEPDSEVLRAVARPRLHRPRGRFECCCDRCASGSRWCPRSLCCSAARSATTSVTATSASDEEVEAARPRTFTSSSSSFPRGTKRRWRRPARRHPAVSASGSELPRAAENAPILILDEPTSSLDAISEGGLEARRLRAGRTTIVIAHRLSTIP